MRARLWAAAIVIGLAGGTAATAQTTAWGEPDFTFRRVTPPPPGTTQRITVQITPQAETAPAPETLPRAAPSAGVAGVSPRVGAADWFWERVSPAREESGPGRLASALEVLETAPEAAGLQAPRLAAMQELAARLGPALLRETVGTKVSPALALSVIAVESAGRSGAVSRAGAIGLMQLMPATAARFDVTVPLDPDQNIAGGVAYLDWLMGHFDNDPILVLAGYNAGEGSVRDHDGVPPYAETRAYVPKVLLAWKVARALCITPPELVSDGCVFQRMGG